MLGSRKSRLTNGVQFNPPSLDSHNCSISIKSAGNGGTLSYEMSVVPAGTNIASDDILSVTGMDASSILSTNSCKAMLKYGNKDSLLYTSCALSFMSADAINIHSAGVGII